MQNIILGFFCLFLAMPSLIAQDHKLELDPDLHHIRKTETREWSDFPSTAEQTELKIPFNAGKNKTVFTLQLRQVNVKQPWRIRLNNSYLADLYPDENDITAYFPIPKGVLNNGKNELLFQQANQSPDDILLGEIIIHPKPVDSILSIGKIQIDVNCPDSNRLLPSRITIVNENSSLQTVGASSNNVLAVRPGVIYTGSGSATFGLPEGNYTIYAGRGMEYGIDSTNVSVSKEENLFHRTLSIRRQVNTEGFISSDTHIHTFTHSRHGDATEEERMLTIAGEGIELSVGSEHNQSVDYSDVASKMNVREYFTPATGNEVTTPLGHFNVFPLSKESAPSETEIKNWKMLFDNIDRMSGEPVIILNHGRDIHSDFTPLSRENFNAVTGEFNEGFDPQFNAMEVINSGAHQTDMMQLFRDWFAMTNRGYSVTPVAGSDSHDVSRFILGQARTFIQLPDQNPSDINISKAARYTVQGKVSVGMGLFVEISVNGKYGPGQLVPVGDSITVHVKVQGPGWVDASVIELYRNGEKIKSQKIYPNNLAGTKWEGTWTLKKNNHDSFLAAITRGPGITKPYWPVARPYQPDSIEWNPEVIGTTGAVWLDEDGNGENNPAYNYAKTLLVSLEDSFGKLLQQLENFDKAVAIQAAGIYFKENPDRLPLSNEMKNQLTSSGKHVFEGFQVYLDYMKEGTRK